MDPAPAAAPPRSPRGPDLATSLSGRLEDGDPPARPPPHPSRPRRRSGGADTAVSMLEAAAAARPKPSSSPPPADDELVVLKDLDTGREVKVEKVKEGEGRGKEEKRMRAARRRFLSTLPCLSRSTRRRSSPPSSIPCLPTPSAPHHPGPDDGPALPHRRDRAADERRRGRRRPNLVVRRRAGH